MLVDFHSHVLPGIDDGSSSLEITKGIIDKQLKDGVDTIVATPHYYCEQQSIDDFISKRNNALEAVKKYYEEHDLFMPNIKLGAEVYYTHYLNNVSDIHKLCIEGTDYLLLELPYKEISQSTIAGILNLADNHNVSLVIAHIERYLSFTSYKSLLPLLNSGVLGQINCGSIVDHKSRKKVKKFIKDGYVHLIGTDVHNVTSRPAYMMESLAILEKKYTKAFVHTLMNNANDVLHNIDLDEIY